MRSIFMVFYVFCLIAQAEGCCGHQTPCTFNNDECVANQKESPCVHTQERYNSGWTMGVRDFNGINQIKFKGQTNPSSTDESREHLLLLCLPLLLQVAVSLQTRFRGEWTRRVPELSLPLLIIQVRVHHIWLHVLLLVLLILLQSWTAETEKIQWLQVHFKLRVSRKCTSV